MSLSVLLVLVCCAASTASAAMLQRVLLPRATAEATGARCLDGSPPAMYYRAPANGSTHWILWLQGGGWCYDEAACVQRAQTNLGSSRRLPAQMRERSLMSSDPSVNGEFANAGVAFFACEELGAVAC